jgi:hypothetical protein
MEGSDSTGRAVFSGMHREFYCAPCQGYDCTIPIDVVVFNLIHLGLSKRDEVKGAWRKLHNEDLHNLYSSTNVITMTKSGRIR